MTSFAFRSQHSNCCQQSRVSKASSHQLINQIYLFPSIMNVQECDGMHLKKLLKLLEQGPKAFNMVKCHPLTSNKNSINFLCQHLFRHRHDLPPNSGKMGRVCHHLIPAYGRGKGLSVFQLSACSLPFGATCSRWRLKTGRAEAAKAGRRVCRAGERFIQDLSRRGFR